MPLNVAVDLPGITKPMLLRTELDNSIKSYDPAKVVAWANKHPESAWAKHLAKISEALLLAYVKSAIELVKAATDPAPKVPQVINKPKVKTKPWPPTSLKKSESARIKGGLSAFATLYEAYGDVKEFRGIFREVERVRRTFYNKGSK